MEWVTERWEWGGEGPGSWGGERKWEAREVMERPGETEKKQTKFPQRGLLVLVSLMTLNSMRHSYNLFFLNPLFA